MLEGTASRVLFGDPSLIVVDAFTKPPFEVTTKTDGASLRVTATLVNPLLKSTFVDTYFADMSDPKLFNDRALVSVDLPPQWPAVKSVEVVAVRAKGKVLPHRLVGHAVEGERGARRLHVQVDVPADGYMRSALRAAGAVVELAVLQ
jgi:hypothetical protein